MWRLAAVIGIVAGFAVVLTAPAAPAHRRASPVRRRSCRSESIK
ncbi:putative membrane protein [Mycobacterium ulcerans str. Harvey]|uniref:Membrane protein n=1 Tax=Mycobacterium ulcerans str. Harvey TaxID=1299332 RepID=A0ABN0R8B4_MYCUL|nr:putative membrane protein [Mycobacterium ulcerans str. Harvey]